MQVTLRKIGNSRGVIIPSPIIEQLHLDNTLEMFVQNGVLHLKPANQLRKGWFDGYDASKDDTPLAQMKDLEIDHAVIDD